MNLEESMRCLKAQFHVPAVIANEAGEHGYRFGEVSVGLSEAHPPGFLAARAWVGRIDPADEASLSALAQANLCLPIAPEAHLCLDGDGEVYLDQRIGGEQLTDEMFLDCLARLVGEADVWQKRLMQAETTPVLED